MIKKILLLAICLIRANCENIIEGRPSGNAACGEDLQWRKFHTLVFGRPCRGYWTFMNTEVMTAGTFDEDYKCHFVVGDKQVQSKELPREMGKYGQFDVLIQTKLCNLAWEKSKQDIPSNVVQARDLGVFGKQATGRTIDEHTYRYGKIHYHENSVTYFPNKNLTPGMSSEFDILVCND